MSVFVCLCDACVCENKCVIEFVFLCLIFLCKCQFKCEFMCLLE